MCRSYRCQTRQILAEKTKNLRLIKSDSHPPPLTWTRCTTSFGHTSRTSTTWHPTTSNPAWSPPSAEYSPSSRRRLWKRHAPSSGSVSRRWLRWRRLHWMDVSSTTLSSYLNSFFQSNFKKNRSLVFLKTTILSFHPVFTFYRKNINIEFLETWFFYHELFFNN